MLAESERLEREFRSDARGVASRLERIKREITGLERAAQAYDQELQTLDRDLELNS